MDEVELTDLGKALAGYTWEEVEKMHKAGMSDQEIAQLAAKEEQADDEASWALYVAEQNGKLEEFDGYSDK